MTITLDRNIQYDPPGNTIGAGATGADLTLSGALKAATLESTGNSHVDGNLDVDGTITAGSGNNTITNAAGLLLPAKLAPGTEAYPLAVVGGVPAFTPLLNAGLGTDVARLSLLTNSGFEVWQRGAGTFTTNGVYTADGWLMATGGGSSMSVDKDSSGADTYSHYAAAVTYTHVGGGYGVLRQKIEDVYQLRARQVTLSARVKANVATAVRLAIQDDGGLTYSSYHTGGGTYETLTVTATIGDASTFVYAQLYCSDSCSAYMDNTMLVLGSVAATYAPLHPADDLARCQRYYEVHGGVSGTISVLGVVSASSQHIHSLISFATTKAGTPTLTKNGTWAVTLVGQPVVDAPYPGGFRIYATSTGSGECSFVTDGADDTVTAEYNL